MQLRNKPLENLVESDLQSLVDDEVREAKTVEYKRSLPGNSDAEKKEFLADVSSFANAAGGYLIYGVEEKEGIPTKITGFEDIDADAEILRLESTIRNGIDPKIPGISTKAVKVTSGIAIVIHIPRSFALPHAVDYKGRWRFYSRNSAGKHPLDVAELRTAFALSESSAERLRSFRIERLSMIASGQTPVTLPDKTPRFVLHILPVSTFDSRVSVDLSTVNLSYDNLQPICARSWRQRHNFDGYLSYGELSEGEPYTYLQLFRTGGIEAVEAHILTDYRGNNPSLPGEFYEKELLDALARFISLQKQMGVVPPLVVMLSILGVSGYVMDVGDRWYEQRVRSQLIDRDDLLLPEALVESFEEDLAYIMKPIFDAVWNAAGWPHSMNYNEEGQWKGLGQSASW
jgi:hypothetical protein